MSSSAIGLTYWLKIREREIAKLNTLKPLARIAKGRISTVYETMSGVKAMLEDDMSLRPLDAMINYSLEAGVK
jgi:hypothetical protein